MVAIDPQDEDRRIIGRVKGNLGRRPADLAYRLIDHGDLATIEWEKAPLPKGTVDALIRGAADDKAERMERSEAAEYLDGVLATGPAPVKDIMKEAKASGIAPRTLARAKAELGVKSDKAADKWYWRLEEKPAR